MRTLLFVGLLAGVAVTPAVLAEPSPRPQPTNVEHRNNLKQIGLAMLNYESANRRYPPPAVLSKDGKPLLSWRVLLLPYLEENNLVQAFKMDEPWDSPHNIKLLDKMPKVFGPIGSGEGEASKTYYRVFTGQGTMFPLEPRGVPIASITDGTSNTVLVVEAHEGVPWTKPDELPYDEKKPLAKLGGHSKGGFAVVMADGSVRDFRQDFDEAMLRRVITRADGLVVDFEKLDR